MISTFLESTSKPVTVNPFLASSTAKGSPTYPNPITPILAFFEFNRYHKEAYLQSLINVAGNIKLLLNNHKSLLNPLYDEHIIEIYLCCYVLLVAGEKDFISEWLYESFDHIIYAYTVLGKYFPTCTNDFYDLLYEYNK